MANISTDFSTWSTTAASNQPDSADTATVQADLQAIQAALRTIFPSVNGAVLPTHTELNYVDGVTSAIQTQLDSKATLAGGTFTGDITMSGAMLITAEGASVAAASSTNIWATDGNTRHVTGNTTINDFATAPQIGSRMKVIFDGTPQLTQSANLNINAGGANITIEAGDWAEVYADTTTQHDVVVHRKSGASVVGGAAATTTSSGIVELITTAELQTGTDTTRAVTVDAIRNGLIVTTSEIATTSGTSHDFTSIPAWVQRMILSINGVSTNGSSGLAVRFGSGGIVSTGYSSSVSSASSVSTSSTLFNINNNMVAASVVNGHVLFTRMTGNKWVVSSNIAANGSATSVGNGNITLAGALDQVRILAVNGTDTFDAGAAILQYE